MNYKKYEMGSYNLHIIKSDKFKTVSMKINFKRKTTKKDITYRNLLKDILLESNSKFKTKRMLNIETEELYNLNYGANNYISGNYSIMSFDCVFLNDIFTEKGMTDKSISFLIDLILKPNVANNKFDENSFRICKAALKDNIESLKDRTNEYSTIRMLEEMDKKAISSYRAIGYLDDLEKIDEHELYEYYESVIKSDLVDVFIIGEVDDTEIKNIFREKFSINTMKKPGLSHYIEHDKFRKRIKTVKEESKTEQSNLIIGLKADKLTPFERKYVVLIYSHILGGGPDSKLFRSVREKNSLCYSVTSSFSQVFSIMTIKVGINAKDYKKAVSLIKKELKNMEKGEFEESEIEASKMTYISAFKEIEDSQKSIISTYVSREYLEFDEPDERIKLVNKVTKNDIINLTKKIHLDTIFLLEGGNSNEEEASN